MSRLVPTSEVAQRKGCTQQAVINALRRGDLHGHKLGPVWAIADDAALAAWTVRETGGRSHRSRDASASQPEGRTS